MPTLDELLKAKQKRLESVPDKFVSNIERVQLHLLDSIEVILAQFDVDGDGFFEITEANMSKAAELDVLLREALDRSEYAEAITEFAKQYNVQIGFNNAYFSQAFKGFEASEIGKQVVAQAQRNAVNLLLNSSPESDFIIPIKSQIENAIITGSRFRETLDTIRTITVGDDAVEGKIKSYSKLLSQSSFAVADRSYASAVAEQMGAEWFKWSGGEIKSTRPFCGERFNKFYCKKEIELWGDGQKTSGYDWPEGGKWAGEMDGTNARTIFSTAGGWGCLHSVMAVSVYIVPIEDVKRAISLGYYEPDDFDREQLGL